MKDAWALLRKPAEAAEPYKAFLEKFKASLHPEDLANLNAIPFLQSPTATASALTLVLRLQFAYDTRPEPGVDADIDDQALNQFMNEVDDLMSSFNTGAGPQPSAPAPPVSAPPPPPSHPSLSPRNTRPSAPPGFVPPTLSPQQGGGGPASAQAPLPGPPLGSAPTAPLIPFQAPSAPVPAAAAPSASAPTAAVSAPGPSAPTSAVNSRLRSRIAKLSVELSEVGAKQVTRMDRVAGTAVSTEQSKIKVELVRTPGQTAKRRQLILASTAAVFLAAGGAYFYFEYFAKPANYSATPPLASAPPNTDTFLSYPNGPMTLRSRDGSPFPPSVVDKMRAEAKTKGYVLFMVTAAHYEMLPERSLTNDPTKIKKSKPAKESFVIPGDKRKKK